MIYVNLDRRCISEERVAQDMLGNTERRLMRWGHFLREKGYEVCWFPVPPDKEFDLVLHSNVLEEDIRGKHHILWAGSWHAKGYEQADATIVVSQYFKDRMKWDKAIVIPCPYDERIEWYMGRETIPNQIICHSNVNRHYQSTQFVANKIKRYEFEWLLFGGNQLYSDNWPECFDASTFQNLKYMGPKSWKETMEYVAQSQIYCYPNDEDSETFCVSAVEAAKLGCVCIVPNRPPFTELQIECEYCSDKIDFWKRTRWFLNKGASERRDRTIDNRYRPDKVFSQLVSVVEDVLR